MKTLTSLAATLTDSPFQPCQIFVPSFGHELPASATPKVGPDSPPIARRSVRLCPSGLLFTNGNDQLAIPMSELWALADKHNPSLRHPTGSPVIPPQVVPLIPGAPAPFTKAGTPASAGSSPTPVPQSKIEIQKSKI